jgi:hypothetical protein
MLMRRIKVARRLWNPVFAAAFLFAAEAEDLPKGVPEPLTPSGVYTHGMLFTTQAYQKEARKLVLQEANLVAKELLLPEKLPLTDSNVLSFFIAPFGFAHVKKAIGNITTENYWYNVGKDSKLSELTIANWERRCVRYREEYKWPTERMDTNSAYRAATQWLAKASMDVVGLNRECQVHAEIDAYWNGTKRGELFKKASFVPIYEVYWVSPNDTNAFGHGVAAAVELFAPSNALLSLRIENPKFILRKPLVFTNLDALLSQPPGR